MRALGLLFAVCAAACGGESHVVVAPAPAASASAKPPKKKLGTCLATLDPPPKLKTPVPGTPTLVPQLAPTSSALAAVSPDGGLAVVEAATETLIVDLDTGAIQARFPEEESGATKLFFRFDRRAALLARVEGDRVEVFDLRTARRVRRFVSTTGIEDLAFADDLRFVRTVSKSGQVESRSLEDDAIHLAEGADRSGLFAFTADAGHVVMASGSTIEVAPVGDVSCGTIEASGAIEAFVVSQDASTIAARVGDFVEVYQTATGARKSRVHSKNKASIALFPAGDRVMIGTDKVAVHDGSGAFKLAVDGKIAFAGASQRIVFASATGLGLVDESGIVIERPIGVASSSFSEASDFALSAEGEKIAVNETSGLRVWPLRGGPLTVLGPRVNGDDVQLSFPEYGAGLIVKSFSAGTPGNGHLRVLDDKSGKQRVDLVFGYGGAHALFRPPKGIELIFSSEQSATIQLLGSVKPITAPWNDPIVAIAWSRDGARIGTVQTTSAGKKLRVYGRATGKLLIEGATEGNSLVLLGTDGAAAIGDKGLDVFWTSTPLSLVEPTSSRVFSPDGLHTYAMMQLEAQSLLRVRSTRNAVVERDKPLPISGALAIDDQGKWIGVVSATRALVLDASTFEVVMDVPCEGGTARFLRGREILAIVARQGAITMLRPSDRTVLHLLFGTDAKGSPHRMAWTDAGAFEAESALFLAVRASADVREKVAPADPKAATKGLVAKILDGK